MGGFYLKESHCLGYPRFYKLYQKLFKKPKESDKCVAWALMREYSKWAKMQCIYENCIELGIKPPGMVNDFIERNPFGPKDEADLMMIYANEESKGFGLEILEHLKRVFTVMRTSWDGSTKGGRGLCLKAGFNRDGNILEWRKEPKDGRINEGERKKEEGGSEEAQGKTGEDEGQP